MKTHTFNYTIIFSLNSQSVLFQQFVESYFEVLNPQVYFLQNQIKQTIISVKNNDMSFRQNALSFLEKFQIHKKLPYSDETVLVDKSTDSFMVMKETIVQSSAELKEVVESLESQRSLKDSHLLNFIQYYTKAVVKDQVTSHKIISFFEYSGHNLLDEVNFRLKDARLFEENQLWNILCSIVIGLAFLQRSQVGHGCVSLLDIFITIDGSLKVVNPCISSTSPSQFTEGYYYSPEMMQFFSNSVVQPEDIDIYKSDVFALALCIIHAAMLQPADSCMDYDNSCVDFDQVEEKLKVLSDHYSQQFLNVLISMLSEHPDDRPDFIELQQHLINCINERDSIFKKDMTLSMEFFNISNRQFNEKEYQQLLFPLTPDGEDLGNQLQGIPVIIIDLENRDVNLKTQVKNSFKLERKDSQIIITESISLNNTERSNTERKSMQQIEAIVFKKNSNKQLQNITSYNGSQTNLQYSISNNQSKIFNGTLENIFDNKKDVVQTQNQPLLQAKQSKKQTVAPASKNGSRKWNVVKQPPKIQQKSFLHKQLQNQKKKTVDHLRKVKKQPSQNSKTIKRVHGNKQNSSLNQCK